MQVTIYSIAEELGVSASTVSRAFSRPELVKESVRALVLAKADELGYVPNRAARGLARGRSGLVGLVVPDVTNPFFPPLVREMQLAVGAKDADLVLINTTSQPETEAAVAKRMRPYVDGLIVASSVLSDEALTRSLASVPSILVNREVDGFASVSVDNAPALREAAAHLEGLGHRRFVLMRGPSGSWAAQRRARAVESWAEGRDVELVELGPFQADFDDGRAAAQAVADSGATAVFAFDDLMAAGLVAGLHDLGRSVPADVSLVGCDDVLLARTMTPALSTVGAPVEELAATAVRLLEDAATGASPERINLQGTLQLRQSTGPAPSRA